MEEVNCLFCNKKHEPFWEEHGYTGRKCFSCGLIYLSPRPDKGEMRALYENGKAGGESTQEHIAYSFIKDLVAKHILSIIKRFKEKGDLLEVGCGGGQFLLNARKEGFNPFAIEVNQELVAYISQQLGIKVEDACASDDSYFPSQKFDIICHINVLSHLHDPIGAFKMAKEKLKEDGILVFETGNLGGVHKFWLNLIGKLVYPEHLYLYSIKSVKRLLKICGFKLIKYYSYSVIHYQLIYKNLTPKKHEFKSANTPNKKISFCQRFKGYILYFLVYHLGKILPKSWPATIIFVAKKEQPKGNSFR